MNQKNSLGLDICFRDLDNPIDLFKEWFDESKKYEQKDPNALALATSDETGTPSVRMVLLKDYDENGFVFFTNFNSNKSNDIKNNPKLYEKYKDHMILKRPYLPKQKLFVDYLRSVTYTLGISNFFLGTIFILFIKQCP